MSETEPMFTFEDAHPGVREALLADLRHAGPYTPDELDQIPAFILQEGSGSLRFLHPFTKLLNLCFERWEAPHLDDLIALPELKHLSFWDSDVRDISAVARMPAFRHIELNRCQVEDLSPLLDCQRLCSFTLDGCPVNEDSWTRVIPELLARGVRHVGNYPMMGEEEYRVMRAMRAAGIELVVFRSAGGSFGVCKPGMSHKQTGRAAFRSTKPIYEAVEAHGDLDDVAFLFKLKEIAREVAQR